MSGFRKTFFKTSKIIDSTFRDNKKYYDEGYVTHERNFDNIRKLMVELKMFFEKTIEPRSKARARISGTVRKTVTKESKDCLIEIIIEDFLSKNGNLMESPTKDAMAVMEKYYHRIASARERIENFYVENTKNSFKDYVEAPAEEIKFMAKKVENKRIELEALKADKKAPAGSVNTAQEAFNEIKTHRENLMIDFTQNSHREHILMFADYMNSWAEFFQECLDVSRSTYSTLNDLYKHSTNKPAVPHVKSGSNNNVNQNVAFNTDNTKSDKSTMNRSFDSNPRFSTGECQASNPFPQANPAPSFPGNANSVTMAEVLFDFDAEADEELSCSAGSTVVIIERIDENWYRCSLGDKTGFVPVNYVKICK